MKILAWPAYKNRARNPFQANLYGAISETDRSAEIDEFTSGTARRFWQYDILHLHWPDAAVQRKGRVETVVRSTALLSYFSLCRVAGVKLVWTAHNYNRGGGPNERLLDLVFRRPLNRLLHGTIFMTENSRTEIQASEPALAVIPHVVIPHGDYRKMEPDQPVPASPVNLQYFGPINPYKNLPALLHAFAGLPEELGVTLRISGAMSPFSPDPAFSEALAALPSHAAARCLHEDKFQEDDELVAKVRAADLVVLPYHKVMNSGSALFALSFDTPVLGPRIPLFEELQRLVGTDWVMLFDGKLTPDQLEKAWTAAKAVKEKGTRPDMSAMDWHSIGAQTLEFYRQIGARR